MEKSMVLVLVGHTLQYLTCLFGNSMFRYVISYACLALNDHDGQNSWDLRLVQAILYRIFSLITLPQPQLVTWPRPRWCWWFWSYFFLWKERNNVFFGQDHISSKSRTHRNQSEKILWSEIYLYVWFKFTEVIGMIFGNDPMQCHHFSLRPQIMVPPGTLSIENTMFNRQIIEVNVLLSIARYYNILEGKSIDLSDFDLVLPSTPVFPYARGPAWTDHLLNMPRGFRSHHGVPQIQSSWWGPELSIETNGDDLGSTILSC